MAKDNISKSDFTFKFAGYGHYKVTYESPVTNKKFSRVTNNMHIIDRTKNTDKPFKTDLNILKRICKGRV